ALAAAAARRARAPRLRGAGDGRAVPLARRQSPAARAVRTAGRRRRPPPGARPGRRRVNLLDVTAFYSPQGGGGRPDLAAHARLVPFVRDRPRLYAGPAARLVGRSLRAAHSGFDLAVAASADNLTGLGVPRTTVVPLGVDTDLFHPARRDPRWKQKIGAAASQ